MKSRFFIALAVALMAIAARLVTADPIGTAVTGSETTQAISGIVVVIVLLYTRRRKRSLV
jgi:hypothetical protein